MKSRGYLYGVGTGARKSLVFFWTAVFLCSLMLQSVAALCSGVLIADLIAILASLDPNMGDCDR